MKSEVFNQSRCAVLRAANLYYMEGCSQKEIAERLAVSVPTVSRLLKRAKEEGLISSRTGSKSCVCLSDQQSQTMQQQLPNTQTLEYIEKMRAMGLTRSQTIALIETLWKEDVP